MRLIVVLFYLCISAIVHADLSQKQIVVAVIDTGIDLQHPDIKPYLWTNKNEIPSNFIDDDNNGYIDDVHGWNFADGSNQIADNHGHGTHVAGLIIKNLGQNINLKIMTLKYYQVGLSGNTHLESTIHSIKYANQMGAQIINYSGGGYKAHPQEFEAIKESQDKGILFVAAAGNEGKRLQSSPFYPAAYNLKNIISVAATSLNNDFFKHSNYDSNLVDIAAPGEAVSSTLPNNKYGKLSGTSQATAIVSGVAALLILNSKILLTPDEVIKTIVLTGKHNPSLSKKTKWQTQLDSNRALTMKSKDFNAAGYFVKHDEEPLLDFL